jgi:hypothetical protein
MHEDLMEKNRVRDEKHRRGSIRVAAPCVCPIAVPMSLPAAPTLFKIFTIVAIGNTAGRSQQGQ